MVGEGRPRACSLSDDGWIRRELCIQHRFESSLLGRSHLVEVFRFLRVRLLESGIGTDLRIGLAGECLNGLLHIWIVAFKIVQVAEQNMVLQILPGAEGHQIARVQFQVGPLAQDDVVKRVHVMNV